ncbi:serine hydrolase domain-containing protein [Roseomonas sp. CCTCC AB2023176]|uniref:serine hydrolase domain-containing protein n=1 Tax=Roseomonas sp. CCTCC AB2023176 TaxID=3342640 RepID=UPI0035DC3581
MPDSLHRRPFFLGAAAAMAGAAARAAEPPALTEALRDAALLPRLRSVIVARGGEVLAERVLRGPGLDVPTNIKSASKSILSALVGIGLARGVLRGLDQPVIPLLGRAPPGADPGVEAITIGHLVSMRAGLEGTSGANYGAWAASRDPVAYALTRPFLDMPGGAMIYSTGSSHMLGAALAAAARRPLLDLARDWLGQPLGVEVPAWPRDPQGRYYGGNDMRLSPRALLRFGEVYRNVGLHGGAHVLPADWVRESWIPRGRSAWSGQLYGYGWWLGEAAGTAVPFAWGYGGQMIYVVLALGVTVVMTSDPDGPRDRAHQAALHALMAERIMPALGARPSVARAEPLRVPEGMG